MLPPTDPDPIERLTANEVKARAVGSVSLLIGRGLLLKVIGFGTTLVLARLLVPRDFGLVALALTIVSLGTFLADSGLGSGLIRRPEPPSRAELSALLGFQIAVATVVGATAATIAVLAQEDGVVTAVMVMTLPLVALRSTSLLLLQRNLQFGKQVIIELVEVMAYTAVTIALALADYGVWSLVAGQTVKAIVGTLVANRLSPMRGILPSRHLSPIRPMLAFGARFQAVGVVHLAQDLGVTAVIAAASDLATLGLWSFATRILQIPTMLFDTLTSVAFPAFSRLVEAGEDVRLLVERMVSVTAVIVTGVLCVLVASSRELVPTILGEDWTEVSGIIATSALALAISLPMTLPGYGYLYAVGDAHSPLVAYVVNTVIRVPLTWLLLVMLGPPGIGLAWAISRPFGQIVIGRALRREVGTSCAGRLIIPTVAGIVAAGAGWELSAQVGSGLGAGTVGGLIGAGLFIAIVAALDRAALREAVAVGLRVMRGGRKR